MKKLRLRVVKQARQSIPALKLLSVELRQEFGTRTVIRYHLCAQDVSAVSTHP